MAEPMTTEVYAIINGEGAYYPVQPADTVADLRGRVLKATRNTGRPPDEWQVLVEPGHELGPARLIADLDLGPKPRIYVVRRIGWQG